MSRARWLYFVAYGDCTSRQPCYTLAEVLAFVSHCLKNGTSVNGITREPRR